MIARYLYNLTANRRCRLIHRTGNQRYLERYWLGKSRRLGITAYLHRFVARDADEWVHDHPWSWAVAIVLTGGYTEERLKWFDPNIGWHSILRQIRPLRPNIIRGRDFHRILECQPETWTLFIHGPRRKGWGFLEYVQCNPPAPGACVYSQPYDLKVNSDWEYHRPLGREADRAPLREAA